MNENTQSHRLLNEGELADHLNVSKKLLQKMRGEGTGPKYIKIGRLVRYRKTDVEIYIEDASRSFTTQGGSCV